MSKQLQDDRKQPFIWLHLELDNLSIDPKAYRLYAHIVRRAGRNGQCWESIEAMAHYCNCSLSVVKRLIRELLKYSLIKRLPRAGKTTIYSLTDAEEWTAPRIKPFDKTQVENDPGQKQPRSDLTQVGGSKMTQVGGSKMTQVGGSKMTHEVDPYEVDPIEVDPLSDPHAHEAEVFEAEIISEPEHESPRCEAGSESAYSSKANTVGEGQYSAVPPPPQNLLDVLRMPVVDNLHPAAKMQAINNLAYYPWLESPERHEFFAIYLANMYRGNRKEDASVSRNYAELSLSNARSRGPGSEAYRKVATAWFKFVQNAQSAQSVDDVVGKSEAEQRREKLWRQIDEARSRRAAERAAQRDPAEPVFRTAEERYQWLCANAEPFGGFCQV